MCKFVPTEWRKLDLLSKTQLVQAWLALHNLFPEFTEFLKDHLNEIGDLSISYVRLFRSFIRFKRLNYSKVIGWMLGFRDSFESLYTIAHTKWLDDD